MGAGNDPRVMAYEEGLKAYALNLPAICPAGLRRLAYFWEHGMLLNQSKRRKKIYLDQGYEVQDYENRTGETK